MKHTISGHNFHGRYGMYFIGAKDGFRLSPVQQKRMSTAFCRGSDCKCGGEYGNGPDEKSARIEWSQDRFGNDIAYLVPAGK